LEAAPDPERVLGVVLAALLGPAVPQAEALLRGHLVVDGGTDLHPGVPVVAADVLQGVECTLLAPGVDLDERGRCVGLHARWGASSEVPNPSRQRGRHDAFQGVAAGLPGVAVAGGVQRRLDGDVAVCLEVHAGTELAGQGFDQGSREDAVLTTAAGEGQHVACDDPVLLFELVDRLDAAVTWIDVDGHEAGLLEGNADAGVRVLRPPLRRRVGVVRGVVEPVVHELAQGLLRARVQGEHPPAEPDVEQRVFTRAARAVDVDDVGHHCGCPAKRAMSSMPSTCCFHVIRQ
jgi:hypothetical protein